MSATKGRDVLFGLVFMGQLLEIKHGIGSMIECQDIKYDIHMPVVVDPLR